MAGEVLHQIAQYTELTSIQMPWVSSMPAREGGGICALLDLFNTLACKGLRGREYTGFIKQK